VGKNSIYFLKIQIKVDYNYKLQKAESRMINSFNFFLTPITPIFF